MPDFKKIDNVIYPNHGDWEDNDGKGFWRNKYKILVTAQGIEFRVNADCEQDAIDYIIDYAEEHAPGLVATYSELLMSRHSAEEIDEYITGGNHCLSLTTHNIHIELLKKGGDKK